MHPTANFLLGVVLATVVFFAWSAVSWMALPWQRAVFKPFADEDAMANVLASQAPESAIYGLPAEPVYPAGATQQQRAEIDQAAWDKLQRGPLVFAVVSRDGYGTFPVMLARAFAGNLVVSLIFGWMLAQTAGLGYAERVTFLFLAGVAAAVACRIPDWNWHKFPLNHTVVQSASLAIGCLLSGLVLAWFVRGRS
jgi:hypothetical protein